MTAVAFAILFALAPAGIVNWNAASELPDAEPSVWANHVVISEFATRGASSAYDEFVEIYNPTSSDVTITGWTLQYWSGTAWSTKLTLSGTLPAHKYYLMASSSGYFTTPTADLYHGTYLAFADGAAGDPRGIRILDDSAAIIDTVLYGGAGGDADPDGYAEGGVCAPNHGTAANANSVERGASDSSDDTTMNVGGAEQFSGNGWDDDNNADDFFVRIGRQPQNLASDAEPSGSDTTPPSLMSAQGLTATSVKAIFNEAVNEADAETAGKWSCTGGILISNPVLQPDNRTVVMTTTTTSLAQYTLTCVNIRDKAGNNRASTSAAFIGGGSHLLVSEVMYNGLYPEPRSDWFEFHNNGGSTVNVASYTIGDNTGIWDMPAGTYNIAAGKKFVVANDGADFYDKYGYYPDFEHQGGTPAVDLAGMTDSLDLSNGGDVLYIKDTLGNERDVAVWKIASALYPGITPATVGESDGQSIQRNPDGIEGVEAYDGASPTGHDETTENQASAFRAGTPTPQTLDSNPPAISSVVSTAYASWATITWTTSESSWPEVNPRGTTKVVYRAGSNPDSGTNQTAESAMMVTSHQIALWDLMPATQYYFYVESVDGLGHVARSKNGGSYFTFTTSAVDASPPTLLSGPTVTGLADTKATIGWTTNEPSTSVVFYGTSASLMSGASIMSMATTHSVPLSGLTPSTPYYYFVRSEDGSGNVMTANNGGSYFTFTTTASVARNTYYGNFHAHTGYSDGTSTPTTAFSYYKNTADAIDFGAITDHSHDLTTTEINDIVARANAATDGTFVGIGGQELGNTGSTAGSYGHMTVINSSPTAIAGDIQRQDLDEAYAWLLSHGSVGSFNHPGFTSTDPDDHYFRNFAYSSIGDQSIEMLEVMNGAREDYEEYYVTALKNGWRIGAEGSQDNHDADWGDKQCTGGNTFTTGIWAPSLTYANLIAGVRAHQTYAVATNYSNDNLTDRAVLEDFTCNGHAMGADLTASGDLSFTARVRFPSGRDIDHMLLIEDGDLAASVYGVASGDYTWTATIADPEPGQHFYYLKWYGLGTDYGVSSPIWVNVPFVSLPDEEPTIGQVAFAPSSPVAAQQVAVRAPVSDDKGVAGVFCHYSVNSGAYSTIAMADDGTGADLASGDGVFSGYIPGQANGAGVEFYLRAYDTSGQLAQSPTDAPTGFYSYYVGVRPIITEIYFNPVYSPEDTEYVEIYNPTGAAISIAGWTIEDQSGTALGSRLAFPAGATIAAGDHILVAKKATSGTVGFQDVFGFKPDYEQVDTSGAVENMVYVAGYTTGMALNNVNGEAVYLKTAAGYIVDAVEYQEEGTSAAGNTAIPDYYSSSFQPSGGQEDTLHRGRVGGVYRDTDDCLWDFYLINGPTPGTVPNVNPMLVTESVAPYYGEPSTTYRFTTTYVDPENNAPGTLTLRIDWSHTYNMLTVGTKLSDGSQFGNGLFSDGESYYIDIADASLFTLGTHNHSWEGFAAAGDSGRLEILYGGIHPYYADPYFGPVVSTLTHDVPFTAGWNLLSFAVGTDGSRTLSDVFSDEWSNILAVMTYDTAQKRWLTYDKSAPAWVNGLKTADETKGYWVKFAAAGDGLLSVTGSTPTSTTLSLKAGWNLVGYPDKDSVQANTALAGTGYDAIQKYDGASAYFIKNMAGTESFVPGKAYWVHVPSDTSYVVAY